LGPIPNIREGGCLAGNGPILSETELSVVGSRADMALGHPNSDHHPLPVEVAGDEGPITTTTSVQGGAVARSVAISAATVAERSGSRSEVSSAALDVGTVRGGMVARTVAFSTATVSAWSGTRTEVYSDAHSARMATEHEDYPSCLGMLGSPTEDVDLVVAETSSESGNNPAYSLVVCRPSCMAATISRGIFVSPMGNARIYRQITAVPGAGQRLMEVGECSNNKSQEVGSTRINGLKDLSHKTNIRLVSSSTAFTNNDTKNCLVWLNDEKLEADRIWNLGKKVGYSRFENEDDILNRLKSLEERDNAKEGLGWGGRNVANDETD